MYNLSKVMIDAKLISTEYATINDFLNKQSNTLTIASIDATDNINSVFIDKLNALVGSNLTLGIR